MRRTEISSEESRLRLHASVAGLAERAPHVSAQALVSPAQRLGLIGAFVLVMFGLLLDPVATASVLFGMVTALYLAMTFYRLMLFVRSGRRDVVLSVSDDEARAFPDELLPTYSVMIPAFREPEVIALLIERVAKIEYPVDRLEVMVLVEADDEETLDAVRRVEPGEQFRIVSIPPAEPRTKPKALNYGLGLATGDLVAVYDAEDQPDPLQLRRAAVAYHRVGPEIGCLQAKLSYHNPLQNLITRWFTIEYAMWFSYFLPGLASSGAPIPLGGTSNHFRRDVLRAMGAWDPFNVTEDADLGIRLYREGFRVAVLESSTLEEANSDFVNWMRQRSRWYKGYLQTFLVNMRAPVELVRDLGLKGFGHFCLFVGGTPMLALMNPVFWVLTVIWFVFHPNWVQQVFPGPVYYAGLLCWAVGNFLMWYLTVISCRLRRQGELLVAAIVVPLYWVMMSMAAIKAFWQLVASPTFWEKTAHGLDRPADEALP